MTLNEITKEQLEEMYVDKDMTLQQIAEELGTTRFKVSDKIKEYNIIKDQRLRTRHKDVPSKEELIDMYIDKNMNIQDIADIYNLNRITISRLIKKYDIIKDKSLIRKNAGDKRRAKNNLDIDDISWKDKVYDLYITQNKTRKETADELGINLSQLLTILNKYNITKPKDLNQKRIAETCIKKYGVSRAWNNDKAKQTRLEKYGKGDAWNSKESHIKSSITRAKNKNNKFKRMNEELLRYLNDNKNPKVIDISKDLNIPYSTASFFINEFNLKDYVDYSSSRLETYFKDFLNKYSIEYIQNDRQQIKPKELDFYIPKVNLAIEINDIASHNSTLSFKNTSEIRPYNYHFNKTQLAKEKGIHLIHIFEYEMMDKDRYNKITSYIKSILNIDTIRVYARNCEVKEISSKEAREFLDIHHFQNYSSSSIKLGLYHKDELVEVMTFGKPRFNKNYEYELIRLCTSSSYKVVGGSQKLFKYFLNKYNPKSIISYCDISKFTGDVYEKLGFTLVEYTQPNYVWTNYVNTFPRYLTQKHKLKEMFNDLSDDYTEDSAMMSHGYVKIYDCGNAKYEFKRD